MRYPRCLTSFVIVVVGLLAAPATVRAAPAPQGATEGVIAAVDAGSFTVTTAAGNQVRIVANAETRIIGRQPVKLEEIKPNEFVGVTAKREPDGTLTAVSINIFPPEFRGRVREAQFVMETGNIMTNAIVFQNVRRVEGRTLYLRMPDGTAVITVPKEAPVLRLAVIAMSDLRPGMRVQVRGTGNPDGSIVATTVTVDVR
jgi:hypothetical protein